jgi:beta-galactosidase
VFRVSVVSLFILAAATPLAAQRQRLSMDPGWRFTLGDPAGAQQPSFDDRRWRSLDLPHDWSIEGTPLENAPGGGGVGYFPGGIGWYRKTFVCRRARVAGWRGWNSMACT